ncbi:MAG: hypothetical protein ACLR6J_10145 [Parabacteroides merdae]
MLSKESRKRKISPGAASSSCKWQTGAFVAPSSRPGMDFYSHSSDEEWNNIPTRVQSNTSGSIQFVTESAQTTKQAYPIWQTGFEKYEHGLTLTLVARIVLRFT